MINLIPTQLKIERKYGRLNLLIAKLLAGITVIGLFSAAVMLSGLQITQADLQFQKDSIELKKTAYDEVKVFEEQANTFKARVSNIKKLYEREVKFSKLLVDIASSIPVGAQLTDLALTGTNTEPLQITAIISSQELAGVLRKNLVDSGIFETADIQNVSLTQNDAAGEAYTVSIRAKLSGDHNKVRSSAATQGAKTESTADQTEQSTRRTDQ